MITAAQDLGGKSKSGEDINYVISGAEEISQIESLETRVRRSPYCGHGCEYVLPKRGPNLIEFSSALVRHDEVLGRGREGGQTRRDGGFVDIW